LDPTANQENKVYLEHVDKLDPRALRDPLVKLVTQVYQEVLVPKVAVET